MIGFALPPLLLEELLPELLLLDDVLPPLLLLLLLLDDVLPPLLLLDDVLPPLLLLDDVLPPLLPLDPSWWPGGPRLERSSTTDELAASEAELVALDPPPEGPLELEPPDAPQPASAALTMSRIPRR
jgi:hypothetical protein